MVIAWKVPNFGVLCKIAPFLTSAHILHCKLAIWHVILPIIL